MSAQDEALVVPSVHLNGTSQEALLEQVTGAADALRAAVKAMEAAAPNARDYYPQGDFAFKRAQAKHLSRVLRVQGILEDYVTLAEVIADAK